ncbi:exonuclease domain-containing protein [Cellulomonas triticagri]|uniref:exonuclease domain-containing protein n=1 Tax=Cellulomonas triticagri TaxID=2483352 RepID=UPI0013150ECE|nr:exonuclease domain-containing protein [Cellulomonas triticagri]
MPLDFTAIDFETAAPARSSVCAVGMTRVRDGVVVESYARLVRPPQGLGCFTNTWVHGIGPEHVAAAPTWLDLLPEVLRFAGSDVLVAHNAAFDRSVLVQASAEYGYDASTTPFVCTLQVAKTLLDLDSYRLPTVAGALGLPPFDHHDAGADARSAALVAVALAARVGAAGVTALGAHAPVRASTRTARRRTSARA